MPDPTTSSAAPTAPLWRRLALGWPAVAVLLTLHYLMAVTWVADLGQWATVDPAAKPGPYALTYTTKTHTFDEMTHILGGHTIWTLGDYRILPENGALPQRVFGIPSAIRGGYEMVPRDTPIWLQGRQWTICSQFYYGMGNNYESFVFPARCMAALFSVLVLAMVWGWTRWLFGPEAALLALTVGVFSPNMLANAPMCSSDMAVTLMFPLSLGALWWAMHRLTWWTLVGSCVAAGLLQVAKFSGLLVLPMVVVLLIIRLASNRPLTFALAPWRREITGRRALAGALAGLFVVHVLAVVLTIWAFYGFRYSYNAFPDERDEAHLSKTWEQLRTNTAGEEDIFTSTIGFAHEHRLLPEAYLYGVLYIKRHSDARTSYLRGEWRTTGWWYYFPYCVAVKTPVGAFLLVLLAAGAVAYRIRDRLTPTTSAQPPPDKHPREAPPAPTPATAVWRAFYVAAPLWVLFIVYWAFAITANLNIGLRHVLPTYPAVFILIGAAAYWFTQRHRLFASLAGLGIAWVIIASLWVRPHYLGFFNVTVGPENGYRHLVDSNLDWGQDVPGLIDWLERHGLNGGWLSPVEGDAFARWLAARGLDPADHTRHGARVYLSYFGSANPYFHGVNAQQLHSYFTHIVPGRDPTQLYVQQLTAGTYCISATQLSNIYMSDIPGRGTWRVSHQRAYDAYRQRFDKLFDPRVPVEQRRALIATPQDRRAYELFEQLRFARLCAYLRLREPDDYAGYSILIYQLTDAEVGQALYGALPLAPDLMESK